MGCDIPALGEALLPESRARISRCTAGARGTRCMTSVQRLPPALEFANPAFRLVTKNTLFAKASCLASLEPTSCCSSTTSFSPHRVTTSHCVTPLYRAHSTTSRTPPHQHITTAAMPTDLEQLLDMGFDKTRSEIAVKKTGGRTPTHLVLRLPRTDMPQCKEPFSGSRTTRTSR